MFSPALLRLCCLAVMAPALTKAVKQADDFQFVLMSENNGDLLLSKYQLPFANPAEPSSTTEDRLGELHPITNGCVQDSLPNGEPWHPEISYNGSCTTLKKNHIVNCEQKVAPLTNCNKIPSDVNGHCYSQSVGVEAPTPKNCDLVSTMNEVSSSNPENMGLISTNTSLDSDFQSKNFNGRYSSPVCPDVSSPLGLEHLQDMLKSPASPPLSPPGSPKSASGESTSTVTAHNPPVVTFTELAEVKASHEKCATRYKDLLLRLRKLQILQLDNHVVEQVKSLYSHYKHSLAIPCQRQLKSNVIRKSKDSVDHKAEFLQHEDVRNLSTAALVSLVKKLESTNSTSNHLSNRVPQIEDSALHEKVNLSLNSRDCTQIKQVSGSLLMRVKHLESAIDSDATDSSSGGESCDEYEGYDEKKSNSTTVQKRALWTWVFERAPIAKRWTWLQSQVQDLEYKVRQIADLLSQARSAKGLACFDEVPPVSDDSSVATKKSIRSVNGYVDHNSHLMNNFSVQNVPPSSEPCPMDLEKNPGVADESCCSVSRTRPLKSEMFRKRKLLYTTGLHYVSRKAARLSAVKCNCNGRFDVMPCILCCGRYNNTQTVDSNAMPLLERVALLDPSFHPVLSFEKDIPLSLHFENHLKTDETYYKVAKPPLLPPPPISIRKTHHHHHLSTRVIMDQVQNRNKRLTKHVAQNLLSTAKNRSNRSISSHRGLIISRWKGIKKKKKKSSFKRKKRFQWSAVSSCCSSRQGSPLHHASALEDSMFYLSGRENSLDLRRRRDGHQFDIDNIVIPYNIKTASSFQKLQYKEIITPKWRYHDEGLENGPVTLDSEMEDISDETISIRHEKMEIAERKILRGEGGGITNLNSARRARRNFRNDSRADSSGANTPDHLSLYHQDIMFQDSNSFISGGPASPTSPPATPGSVNTISDDSQPSCSNMLPVTERRRTISFTKKEGTPVQLTIPECVHHQPFDLRTFPLQDSTCEEMKQESELMESLYNQEHEREGNDNEEDVSLGEPNSPERSPDTSSSTSSAFEEDDDDVADPEWTVVPKQNEPERTLVLKLAKR